MHRCLNIDEIVRLIACELAASGGKATAVCLACCCQGFEDPVLDALWTTQVELFPLFECLPGDVWKEGRHTVSTPTTRVLLFSQRLGLKVLQTPSDDDRMGSFSKVCSKNARAQWPCHSGHTAFGGLFRDATLRNQRTLAPKSDNSRFVGNPRIVHSIHPAVPFPYNHLHQFHIL